MMRLLHIFAVVVALCLILFAASACWSMELTASWYSVESLKKEGTWRTSHGKTASGEQFSESERTCATWDYPLHTILRVRSRDGLRNTVVRVNDRTAKRFKGKRIDLSPAAFREIARLEQGVVPCIVEVVK